MPVIARETNIGTPHGPRHERGSEACFGRAIKFRLLLLGAPTPALSCCVTPPVLFVYHATRTFRLPCHNYSDRRHQDSRGVKGIGREGLEAWSRSQVRPSTDVCRLTHPRRPPTAVIIRICVRKTWSTPSSLTRATRTPCWRLGKNRLRSRADVPFCLYSAVSRQGP